MWLRLLATRDNQKRKCCDLRHSDAQFLKDALPPARVGGSLFPLGNANFVTVLELESAHLGSHSKEATMTKVKGL